MVPSGLAAQLPHTDITPQPANGTLFQISGRATEQAAAGTSLHKVAGSATSVGLNAGDTCPDSYTIHPSKLPFLLLNTTEFKRIWSVPQMRLYGPTVLSDQPAQPHTRDVVSDSHVHVQQSNGVAVVVFGLSHFHCTTPESEM